MSEPLTPERVARIKCRAQQMDGLPWRHVIDLADTVEAVRAERDKYRAEVADLLARMDADAFTIRDQQARIGLLEAERDRLQARVTELTAEWAVMARACGNWREWPGQATEDYDHPDWKAAARAIVERDKLRLFKTWVHSYLDEHGVPHHPPGTHGAAGCRIGDRMDWVMARVRESGMIGSSIGG